MVHFRAARASTASPLGSCATLDQNPYRHTASPTIPPALAITIMHIGERLKAHRKASQFHASGLTRRQFGVTVTVQTTSRTYLDNCYSARERLRNGCLFDRLSVAGKSCRSRADTVRQARTFSDTRRVFRGSVESSPAGSIDPPPPRDSPRLEPGPISLSVRLGLVWRGGEASVQSLNLRPRKKFLFKNFARVRFRLWFRNRFRKISGAL